jgi:hypothetical protein
MINQVPGFTVADADRWTKSISEGVRTEIVKSMKDRSNKMVDHARKNHKFKTITGKADASIKNLVEYNPSNKSATMTFYIDPSSVMVGGYNRTWMLNDGTYGSYKKGSISPTARTVGGAPGTGIKHDDFMGNAWSVNLKDLEEDFKVISERMTRWRT